MKLLALFAALGLAVAALPMLAPSASAVGTCTKVLNPVNSGPDCPYLFCYGTSWSYPNAYVRCYECFEPGRPECDWPFPLP